MLPSKRRTLVLITALVVITGVVSTVAVVYIVTRPPPIPLTISDGSTMGVVEANFSNYSSITPFVRHFNATTFANQSAGTGSALALRLRVTAFFIPGYNLVETDIQAIVQGKFASDLNLSGLTLTYNQTGQFAAARGGTLSSPTNVSYDPAQIASVTGPGSSVLTPTLLNQTASAPFYEFVFPTFFMSWLPVGYNHFVGLRATVTGRFTPVVNVGILLQLIDVPG